MVFESPFPRQVPDEKYKDLVSNFFWHQLDKFAERVLFVDLASGRDWTGGQIKRASALLAHRLISKCALQANSDTLTLWYHNDEMQLLALATLFAGASVCVVAPEDPEREHEHAISMLRPQMIFVERRLVEEVLAIRERCALAFDLVIMDDNKTMDEHEWSRLAQGQAGAPSGRPARLFGFHRDLFEREPSGEFGGAPELPVEVAAERPAFVLFTSGSTGQPKPVGRSQRNSLYVCHSFYGAEVARAWHLGAHTVMAGHLQLDHGTGTFCLKQALAHGYKLVLMHGFHYGTLLEAIRRFRITDCLLGSALLHNFVARALSSPEALAEQLGSLRNFLAVGSPIASAPLVQQFMARLKNCSVRQAYGMTEVGFLAVSDRDAHELGAVGSILPNMEVKLVHREAERAGAEITRFEQEGEVYVRGPTVSPGYLGEQFREQAALSFLPDGFYKSNDIGKVLERGRQLVIRGRYNEVLCLHDGWKVLPSELEQALLRHPQVKEAVVFGIPHPELPSCHAARAYVVPKDGVPADFDEHFERKLNALLAGSAEPAGEQQPDANCRQRDTAPDDPNEGPLMARRFAELSSECASQGRKLEQVEPGERLTKQHLFNFTAAMLSEPKHLVGGIRIVSRLPRISLGKFDKKLLRKIDGFTS